MVPAVKPVEEGNVIGVDIGGVMTIYERPPPRYLRMVPGALDGVRQLVAKYGADSVVFISKVGYGALRTQIKALLVGIAFADSTWFPGFDPDRHLVELCAHEAVGNARREQADILDPRDKAGGPHPPRTDEPQQPKAQVAR